MKVVLARIAGRENAPAESVFENIQVPKGVPAGRLPRIMNLGWGRSLRVSCRHCHDTERWSGEDKREKQVARAMTTMVGTINNELLPRIKNLKSDKPIVNCTTCHRGTVKPALNLFRGSLRDSCLIQPEAPADDEGIPRIGYDAPSVVPAQGRRARGTCFHRFQEKSASHDQTRRAERLGEGSRRSVPTGKGRVV
jgi:hypothetical protein